MSPEQEKNVALTKVAEKVNDYNLKISNSSKTYPNKQMGKRNQLQSGTINNRGKKMARKKGICGHRTSGKLELLNTETQKTRTQTSIITIGAPIRKCGPSTSWDIVIWERQIRK